MAGDLPEFDKEFKVDSESERPLFLLFTEGSRVPKRHSTSEDLVRLGYAGSREGGLDFLDYGNRSLP